MKKVVIGILLLPLLTGCWDRLPLKNIHLVDMAGFDFDEESGDVVLNYIVTEVKSTGQGGGEPISKVTELKGHSLIEAVGKGQYSDQGPFFAINTGLYFMSKRFASHDPVQELAFLLQAPYTMVNTPVIVLDGNMSKNLKSKIAKDGFTRDLFNFTYSLEKNGIIPESSMMSFILSRKDPLKDMVLPVVKPSKTGMELDGALLFRQGTNTGKELDKDQVQMLMLMLGKDKGRQYFTGNLSNSENNNIKYGFSVKKNNAKIVIHPETVGLPNVKINVRLQINVFQLGKSAHILKPDYVKRMEKELSKHLEKNAMETIKTLQKANCDSIGIGNRLSSFYPDIWKSLNWRKDYPQLSIEPVFEVEILNSTE